MNINEPISPPGQTSQEVAAEDYANDERYRAVHDRLAPYRVIARAVILERSRRHWTQKQLGALIGAPDSAISRIESGRHPVTLETLEKLGIALGIAFQVGAASATDKTVVVVPQAAIEKPAARPADPRPVARQAPSRESATAATVALAFVAAEQTKGGHETR